MIRIVYKLKINIAMKKLRKIILRTLIIILWILIISGCGGNSNPKKPETEAIKIILMSAVGANRFLEDNKFTVRNFVASVTIGKELSQFLKDTLKVSNLKIFCADPEYWKSVRGAVIKNCIENKFKTSPQNFSAITYDGVNLLFPVIKKAGTLNSDILINELKMYKVICEFYPVSVSDRNIKYRFASKTLN